MIALIQKPIKNFVQKIPNLTKDKNIQKRVNTQMMKKKMKKAMKMKIQNNQKKTMR